MLWCSRSVDGSTGQPACDQCCQTPPKAARKSAPGCRRGQRSSWGGRRGGPRCEEASGVREKQKLPFRCELSLFCTHRTDRSSTERSFTDTSSTDTPSTDTSSRSFMYRFWKFCTCRIMQILPVSHLRKRRLVPIPPGQGHTSTINRSCRRMNMHLVSGLVYICSEISR